jgi:hypothetical protein
VTLSGTSFATIQDPPDLEDWIARIRDRDAMTFEDATRIDRTSATLAEAVKRVYGLVEGTLIICSDRLGYYEGEPPNNSFILHRP